MRLRKDKDVSGSQSKCVQESAQNPGLQCSTSSIWVGEVWLGKRLGQAVGPLIPEEAVVHFPCPKIVVPYAIS